ncbi:MAG TPA: hypothetical protein VIO57_12030, partial [Chloroflexota bacterium]
MFTEHFDDYVEARSVPVPERIAKYHPAVKAFLADKEWQYVTSEHVPRAGRAVAGPIMTRLQVSHQRVQLPGLL